MIVHRFMSMREYNALMAGEELHNDTIHKTEGLKSTSVGFCFFTEDPEEAIHWLSFLVDADACVTLVIPQELLSETQGRYRDVEKDKGNTLLDAVPMMWRTEYCLTDYSLQTVRVISMTEKYRMYGKFPENATFWERIERLRMVGESETRRQEAAKKKIVLARGHHIRNADGTITDVSNNPEYECRKPEEAAAIDKKDILHYLQERHLEELASLSDFAKKIQQKGVVEGCVAVRFTDGTTLQYDIHPNETDDVLTFVQSLSVKRTRGYIEKQKTYIENDNYERD